MRGIQAGCLLALLVLFFVPTATGKAGDEEHGSWHFLHENDAFNGFDRHYTGGLQAGWASGYLHDFDEAPLPGFLADALDGLPLARAPARRPFVNASFTHRMFTPGDIDTAVLVEDDIPYTSLAYVTLAAGRQDAARLDAFSLQLGVAGPSSRGEEFQRFMHEVLGASEPRGWEHQVRDEVLLNVGYEHRRRLLAFGSGQGFGGDVIGQAGVKFGNLATLALAGVGVRAGWGGPDDDVLSAPFLSEEMIGARGDGGDGVWLFALLNVSAWGHAIFLDGNTFKASHSIDYDRWAGRLYTGVSLRRGRFGLSLGFATATIPWINAMRQDTQGYGRLTFVYRY